jgi:hypothetical protein
MIIPGRDADFVEFDAPINGIRAGAKILVNYFKRYGLSTVAGIIGRWAPPNENDTPSYCADVCARMAVAPDDRLAILTPQVMQNLVTAIIWHEQGCQPYDAGTIAAAVALALS